jgi:hypothetical protein
MKEIIRSLQILSEYTDLDRPVVVDPSDSDCLHIYLNLISKWSEMEYGDIKELEDLGWHLCDQDTEDMLHVWTYRYTP